MNKQTFGEKDAGTNPNLKFELTKPTELSGILNWAIQGLIRYLERGYFENCRTPEETRELWTKFGDSIASFFSSGWVKFDRDGVETKEDLYEHWLTYNETELGQSSKSKIWFGRQMTQRYVNNNIIKEGWKDNKTAWRGIQILDPDSAEPPTGNHIEELFKEQDKQI